ncbi:MAG: hypothetical protein MJ168_10810 [Clostridia bacterium]|nr:hypothetical protein [Clostridia bacterium]
MEKFNIVTVAHVTGYSVASVNSWAAKNNISVKDGLTVLQIIEFLKSPKRKDGAGSVDAKAAARLKTALEVMGALESEFKLEA